MTSAVVGGFGPQRPVGGDHACPGRDRGHPVSGRIGGVGGIDNSVNNAADVNGGLIGIGLASIKPGDHGLSYERRDVIATVSTWTR